MSFAAQDVRPIVAKLDGALLDVICTGTTGGWGGVEDEIKTYVHGPYILPKSVSDDMTKKTCCLRMETIGWFFPHVRTIQLVTTSTIMDDRKDGAMDKYHRNFVDNWQRQNIPEEYAKPYIEMINGLQLRVERLQASSSSTAVPPNKDFLNDLYASIGGVGV